MLILMVNQCVCVCVYVEKEAKPLLWDKGVGLGSGSVCVNCTAQCGIFLL